MGLDLGIVRKPKGPAYEACAWEDVCWWRNCWAARDIMLDSISTYDKENNEAMLTLGAIQKMLENLVKETSHVNFNKGLDALNDNILKIYLCIADLAKLLYNDAWEDMEYEYKLIDGY